MATVLSCSYDLAVASEDEQIHQIRTHLVYEVKWLVYAAARFAEEHPGDPKVALIDSAAIHARNLFEFATKPNADRFTLCALGGEANPSKPRKTWETWVNNRVTHMLDREHYKAPWPGGGDDNAPDRLMTMAGAVLDQLEDGRTSIPTGPVRDAYELVTAAARRYWSDPSDKNHDGLARLYDDARSHGTRPRRRAGH